MGARRDFPIDEGYAGGRLETFLRRKLGLPRTLALKALRKGWVRLGGKRAKADARLDMGVVVTITNPALELPGLAPREAPRVAPALVNEARRSIRFRDDDVVVSAKPAGAVVHAGSGHESGWVDALRAALGSEECVPIGRLDRDTSGLLLCTLRRAATRGWFEELKAGRVRRVYTALVRGRVESERGEISAPLDKVEKDGLEQTAATEDGKPSLTRFEVVRRFAGATLLRVTIDTGRTQQIRAHMEHVGHPILGDPRHGGAGDLARKIGLTRTFLHAGTLELGNGRRFEEPLPQELANPLARL
ncbi:MAG TPA: RluA family pseudouridine synthase [Planctomycetota bacterium]|nr:RluA family pseudouridine synthase [Planctomycetota bacterium]